MVGTVKLCWRHPKGRSATSHHDRLAQIQTSNLKNIAIVPLDLIGRAHSNARDRRCAAVFSLWLYTGANMPFTIGFVLREFTENKYILQSIL